MNPHAPSSLLAPALIATVLSSPAAFASFVYTANPANPYAPGGANEVFTVISPSVAAGAGVTVDFSSTISGIVGTNPAATPTDSKILFETTEIVTAGTPITFCFDFSHILAGPDDGGGERFASELRWFENTPGLDIDVQYLGGNDTFANYAGATAGTGGGARHWNNTTNGFQSVGANNYTTFTGFSSADTGTYTSTVIPAGDFGIVSLRDINKNVIGMSAMNNYWTITPQADLAVGTQFQWSLGGEVVEPIEEPVGIPEPGRAALLLIGMGFCLGRRNRRR